MSLFKENDYNHIKLQVCIALSAVAAMSSLAGFFFGGVNEDQIFKAVQKVEALKVGGEENYAKLMELYNSEEFKKKQAQSLEQALQQMGWAAQQPTQQNQQANSPETATPSTTTFTKNQIEGIKKNAYIDGNKSAKILIVEYTDPECPFCVRHFKDNTIKSVIESDKKNIAHIMKLVQGVNHPGTEFKSLATLCAGKLKWEQGYYNMFASIMSEPSLATNDQVFAIADKAGIKKNDLESCMQDPTVKATYIASWAEAQSLGQWGTPGNLIINTENGKYVALAGAYPKDSFISAIKQIQ